MEIVSRERRKPTLSRRALRWKATPLEGDYTGICETSLPLQLFVRRTKVGQSALRCCLEVRRTGSHISMEGSFSMAHCRCSVIPFRSCHRVLSAREDLGPPPWQHRMGTEVHSNARQDVRSISYRVDLGPVPPSHGFVPPHAAAATPGHSPVVD